MTVKAIHAPHLGRTVKLGRKRPANRIKLHLRDYLRLKDLPPTPPSADYSSAATSALANIYGNDNLGDCVIAGGYHVVGVETGNAGALFTATDAQIIADYSAIGGYVAGDPSTDNGCDEQTAMNYWQATGFANGTKLAGSLAIDATNVDEIKAALFLFENLFFGVELPDGWINPFPSADGFIWDVAGDPDPSNGHAYIGYGYNDHGILIDSWGLDGLNPYAAIAKYAVPSAGGQLYVLFSPDQIDKAKGKAPNGLTWDELTADFAALGGASPLPPPPPTPGPSLEDAIAWATQGLTDSWPTDKP